MSYGHLLITDGLELDIGTAKVIAAREDATQVASVGFFIRMSN